jgi:DNA-binding GntR family transcriptional regulator
MITNPKTIGSKNAIPKYVRLSEWLRGVIEKGRYPLGERMSGKDKRVIQIKRVRCGNGIPLVLERSYYSYKEFKKILTMDIPDSLYSTLVKTFGVTLEHSIQTLRAIALPDKDAVILGVDPGFPATLQESIIYDNNNIVVEVLHSCYRGDKFVFKVESGKFSPTI